MKNIKNSGTLDAAKLERVNDVALQIAPATPDTSLVDWLLPRRDAIDDLLLDSPGLLFRGFSDTNLSDFSRIFSEPLDYVYQSTPRTRIDSGVYTATEYPQELEISQHCENSYQRTWPLQLYFRCEKAALSGGETPLCDMRMVTAQIPSDIKTTFQKKGVMYVRNYHPGLDLPWETVFQTRDRGEVESFCRKNSINFEWLANGCLRTTQVCQGMARHPKTHEELWFNQAHLFHSSNLDKDIREYLIQTYSENGLPRNAYFGDGTPIDDGILQEIRAIFSERQVAFTWKDKDLLLVDNMLCSHGRKPYSGPRKVLVSMGNPFSGFAGLESFG